MKSKSKNGKNHEFITACKDSYIKGKKKGHADGLLEGISFTTKHYSAVVLLVLKDHFDFTNKQIEQVTKHINTYFENATQDIISLNEVIDTLTAEYGIEVGFNNEVNISSDEVSYES